MMIPISLRRYLIPEAQQGPTDFHTLALVALALNSTIFLMCVIF